MESKLNKELLRELFQEGITKIEFEDCFDLNKGYKTEVIITNSLGRTETIDLTNYVDKLKHACEYGELPFCEELVRQTKLFSGDQKDDNGNFYFEEAIHALWATQRMAQLEEWSGQAWDIYINIQDYLMYNAICLTCEDIAYIRG